ncbi:histidine kinase [Roseospira marina]|uniref:Histidine kinase n=1 Tax=Roseospira marina TaxID=140057 RepID=A0A5M6IFV0_9PROT|nr:PocR ligand-binding domain-containing protein [Roseospira marina]KAA5607170.1 histidine kinase [Roseospira marina]
MQAARDAETAAAADHGAPRDVGFSEETTQDQRVPSLSDLISVERLQKVQDNFSAAVGIAMIIVGRDGQPVTQPSGFSNFCRTVRLVEARRDQCFRCDNEGGRMAMATGQPSLYQCHCGLVDFAAPIVIRGHYLGAVISGQVRLNDVAPEELPDYIFPPDFAWLQDPTLVALREQTNMIPYTKLRSASYTLYYLAEYLVEESYSNTVSQELSAKSLKLMEESKKRVELEKSLQEAELQALSYQVNPHFLFNVLNTIGRLALMEHADKTEEMVYAFSDMMRYILKKSSAQIVSLGTELEHVRNYLYIQKVRMSGRFTFDIDVPAKYLSVQCPFMVLNPIVENSIHYAVEPHASDGRVTVTARDDGTDVILEVVDTGDGVDPAMVAAALDGRAEHHGRTSIGLRNVDSRLRHFFGEDHGLEIESPVADGRGTRVRMRFPLEFDPFDL